MKRFFFLFLLTIFVSVTSGCGKKDDLEVMVREPVDPAAAKVGICIYRFDDDFMTLYREELERYLIELGYKKENIFILDSENSQTKQDDQIDSLIQSEVDVLIINPVDATAADRITDKARKNGLPLVYINREPAIDEQNRWESKKWDITYVGADSRQSGSMQGELISDIIQKNGLEAIDHNNNGEIDYVMIEGDQNNIDARNRTQESIGFLTSHGYQVHCLDDEVGNWETDEGQRIASSALSTYGTDVEVIFCNNDAMALGALDAIESAGRKVGKDIYLVGVDALVPVVEAIIEGRITGTVYNDFSSQAHAAADAVTNYLSGAGNSHYISCDYVKVSSDNAADILEKIK